MSFLERLYAFQIYFILHKWKKLQDLVLISDPSYFVENDSLKDDFSNLYAPFIY